MNCIVLSGTRTFVPSGTGLSCYRGRKLLLTFCCAVAFRARNSANLESFGFLLTIHSYVPATSEATVARLSERRLTTLHQNRFAAAILVVGLFRRITAATRGLKTSPNTGAVG